MHNVIPIFLHTLSNLTEALPCAMSLQSSSTASAAEPTTAQVALLQLSLPGILYMRDNAIQDA